MVNDHIVLLETKRTAAKVKGKPRKPYHKPQLEELGDLRDLTLGGSPGVGDSGGSFTRRPRRIGASAPSGLYPSEVFSPPDEIPTPDYNYFPPP